MNIFKTLITSVLLLLTLIGCQGSNSESSSVSSSTEKGTFVDALVKGLRYKTETKSGFTDEKGNFLFEKDENCEFWLGNLSLGKSKCDLLVTPYTLAGDKDISSPSALTMNIAMLLQNFDSGRNNQDLLDVSSLQGYDFTTIDLSSSTQEMELDILALLADPLFQSFIDPDDHTLINSETASGLLQKNVKEATLNPVTPPVDINATSDVKSISIVNGNTVTVVNNGETKDIYITTFNSSGSSNTEGKITFQWPAESINGIDLGTVSPSVADIVDGRAHFVYTAPSDLKAREEAGYTKARFLFYSTVSGDVNTFLEVNFDSSSSVTPSDPVLKTLVLSTPLIQVSSPSQVESINLFAYTGENTTNVNTTLGVRYSQDILDNKIDIGYLPTVINVANGKASFQYNGPKDLDSTISKLSASSSSNPVNVTVYDTITGVSTDLSLNFELPLEDDYSRYRLTAVPTLVTITEPSQEEVIDLYLRDDKSRPVANEKILLDYFDGLSGTMNTFSAITDNNGHVLFEYKAPESVSNGTLATLTFRGENSTLNTARTVISVNTEAQVKDYSSYVISLTNPNRIITQGLQVETFDVYLKDASSKPAVGDTIIIDFFDGNNGTVNTFSAITDSLGHVKFIYTAPEQLTNLNNTRITFRIENTTKSVDSIFTVSSAITEVPNIHVDISDSTFTLTEDAQSAKIKVLAFNKNNEAFNSGSILVRYPSEIVNGGISAGKFIQSEVNIINGEAIFDFVGPDVLSNINSLNFIFVYKEDTTISTTLTMEYSPSVATVILGQSSAEITLNSEVVNIDVRVVDGNNNPYATGNVGIIYPDDATTGRDIGSFAQSTVPVVAGKAEFVYTAPSALSDNTSPIIFKFYHDSQILLSKEFTITISPEANQTVLNSYTLNNSMSDDDITMNLQSNKFMSFFVKDNNDNLVPDSNMTSIKVTMLNPMLGTLQDSLGNQGTSLTITDKNNVTLNINSNTISGIIPLEVEASFSDINENNQTILKVFNIVVLSGPPSAISLSYAGTLSEGEQYTEAKANAKFVENWVVSVTDKYNNRVDSNPALSMGMLAGYANSAPDIASNPHNFLYYKPSVGGELQENSPNNDIFEAPGNVFSNVNSNNEVLALFGNGYTYNASGKWDFYENADNKLSLVDDYDGNDTASLGFAVGNNFRQDACKEGVEWIGNVYPKDNDYILGDTGNKIIQVEYDYYMVGKDVVLWVNLLGYQHDLNKTIRIGEARKATLRGEGIGSTLFTFSKGYSGVVRLNLPINNTEEKLRNSNFGYDVNVESNDANWTVSDSSIVRGITYCIGENGESFVDVNFTTPTPNGGTVSLSNTITTNEF